MESVPPDVSTDNMADVTNYPRWTCIGQKRRTMTMIKSQGSGLVRGRRRGRPERGGKKVKRRRRSRFNFVSNLKSRFLKIYFLKNKKG